MITEQAQGELEGEIAEICGLLNAATGRLVALVCRVLETEAWQGHGIVSPAHYVAWKCGMSPARAASLVAMARRRGELPHTLAALEAGELCEDQVAVVCRHAPGAIDAQAAALARSATVAQLRRVLSAYSHTGPNPEDRRPEDPDPEDPDDESPRDGGEAFRHTSAGYTERGTFRLSAELPADEGAVVERALAERRDALFAQRHPGAVGDEDAGAGADEVSWSDALVSMAERSLDTAAAQRSHHHRTVVNIHMGLAGAAVWGHLHLGPALSDDLRRYATCDAKVRAVMEAAGLPVSVGRTRYSVPARTRLVIENRDRGCRVPGCNRDRWVQVHHIVHWEDGGSTDISNLVALCPAHHRLHHRGLLDISGNPDEPDGLVFTDPRGRRLTGCGRPAPPQGDLHEAAGDLGIEGNWSHPTGERWDGTWLHFDEYGQN